MNSVFEIFSKGFGPSSSHTVGPTKAANRFCAELMSKSILGRVSKIKIDVYGSLANTGVGHGTDIALVYGLLGHEPHSINIDDARREAEYTIDNNKLMLAGIRPIYFSLSRDITYNHDKSLSRHPNGIKIKAFGENEERLLLHTYYSIGGGFIIREGEKEISELENKKSTYGSFDEFKNLCKIHDIDIFNLALKVETSTSDEATVYERCYSIWKEMRDCLERGFNSEQKILPGGLNLKRRAPQLYLKNLKSLDKKDKSLSELDYLNLCAMAVSEENAAGNKIVTAPTNGAAGVIPSILSYIDYYIKPVTPRVATEFLLVAGVIANIYKKNASISGAEVGCQGEVGVASSMAAGALAHTMGGDISCIENAAEIAMEHHLGMTCDPVKGLVQVPCIERNAMGAVKALNAARMAVFSPNEKKVSLDDVVRTMYQTGNDMSYKYKETSKGGLAINIKTI